MKRIALVLLLAAALVFAFSSVAFANYGPHGGYTQDTDACAGCHRAHTSFSSLTWTGIDGVSGGSALLVSDATNMTDFCYACHGDGAPGASTNVQMGVFDSGPTGGTGTPSGPTVSYVPYASNSSYGATLNAGGFERLAANAAAPVMSSHEMRITGAPKNQGVLARWGAINGANTDVSIMSEFRCTDCHDPHGSSNYRLLKDEVNGRTVGGQISTAAADGFVMSNEENFPPSGFRKGVLGQAEVAAYVPNYTVPQYRAADSGRGMSTWCSACHNGYNEASSTANYFAYESILSTDGLSVVGQVGPRLRHRHKVDIPLEIGQGPSRALAVSALDDSGLPLEMPLAAPGAYDFHTAKPWDPSGNISCLTCHLAHGSAANSSGWANAVLTTTPVGASPRMVAVGDTSQPGSSTNVLGVNPNFSQSILRYDNRGVCERCHNK